MPYQSVDALQQALTQDVFHYAKDAKKAAGRALGTLVEVINFYLLKAWGYENHTAIERRIPEYANPELTHNVEFSLHPTEKVAAFQFKETDLPFTAAKIRKQVKTIEWKKEGMKSNQLLSKTGLLRNSCVIYQWNNELVIAYLADKSQLGWNISVEKLRSHPFAIFECKRVGVEEGIKKGPQTIEKAKQGAYVAKVVSSLQKLRMADGTIYGFLNLESGELRCEPYEQFLKAVVNSEDPNLLRHFILTVGIVSNHGNWFTSSDRNKELKILAQSYDWLLFLTDVGLAQFVEELLLKPNKQYREVKEAFQSSYTGVRGKNKFTKVQIALTADKAIQEYFRENLTDIESWFNVLSPAKMTIHELKNELQALSSKNWRKILK
ncbi:MAG: hypothetical protein SXA11_14845 [Cyanobacteriota bacterium]|nr:hypothetical protein [Cyanobacteriota bacterium]